MTTLAALGTLNWPFLLNFWTAIIATFAVQNWKRQSKAQKEMEFLDKLTDAVHEFIAAIQPAIQVFEFTKIAIDCQTDSPPEGESHLYQRAVGTFKIMEKQRQRE